MASRAAPGAAALGGQSVDTLHLAAGLALFKIEIETDEAKDEGNGFGVGAGMLDGEGVDDVLVDKARIAEFEGVEREFIELFAIVA